MDEAPQHLIYRGYDGFGGFRLGDTYTLHVGTEDRETYILHPTSGMPWGRLPDGEFWKIWEPTKKAPTTIPSFRAFGNGATPAAE